MKRRNARRMVIVGLLVCGFVAQFGGCLLTGLGGTLLSSIDFCSLLGPNCVLGPFAPCGNPNTAADDLLVDCPDNANTNGSSGTGT